MERHSNSARAPARRTPAAKRAHILALARALFASQKYDGTTLRAIADRAETALGSATYVCGSKPAIAAAIQGELAEPLVRVVRLAIGPGPIVSSAARITEQVDAWLGGHPDDLGIIDTLDAGLLRDLGADHRDLARRLIEALGTFGGVAARCRR